MKYHLVLMGLLGLCVVAGCEPPPGNSGRLPQSRTARNGLEGRKVYHHVNARAETTVEPMTQHDDGPTETGRPRKINDNLDLVEAVLTKWGKDLDSNN